MKRYRKKKKALYEVIGKANYKLGNVKSPQEARQTVITSDEPDRSDEAVLAGQPEVSPGWPNSPKAVQFNAGRVDLSVPYPVAIAAVMGIVLMVLVVFKLGQFVSYNESESVGNAAETSVVVERPEYVGRKVPTKPVPSGTADVFGSAVQGGDHRIVIVQYPSVRDDLEPVQRHFAGYGIKTMIEKRGGSFFLLSADAVQNPSRSGSNGNKLLKEIVDVGAKYKAPKGFESFAPKLFSDAYGEKIK